MEDICRGFVPAPPSAQKMTIRRTAESKSVVDSRVEEKRKRVTPEENRGFEGRKSALGRVQAREEESRDGAGRSGRRMRWGGGRVGRKTWRLRDNHSVHRRAGRSPEAPRMRTRGTGEQMVVPRERALPPRGR
jgi:hypothetical protein